MIIFLHGEDTYRMKEKLKEIVEKYKKVRTSGLNLKYFEGSGNFFESFKSDFKQISMFKEKKLSVVLNPFDDAEFKESFLDYGKEFLESDDIVVIYQEGKIAKNNALLKYLNKNAKSQEFGSLSYAELKTWVKKELERYGARIDSMALDKLIEYIGNDLWRMSNEIKKLASYNKSIEIANVKLLVRSSIETDIFKTIEAIAQKNKKQALALLYKHVEKGDSPVYLLSMINFQFRNLLIIKDLIEKSQPYYSIAKKSGLHPFVVKKAYYSAQQFSFQELKNIYEKIFKIDLQIKTGQVEPATALDLFIAELS
ncbi:DNA polymerase III subunit delta [Patescibacteria group bacterium]|nr:DNA polymerase III subunit delta [Patescibacteria group bacterium]